MREQAAMSVEQIVERVWLSIAERRLRPGVQLKEEQLASIFHVSRARVRQALTVLARDGLLTIIPNRGAFVCKPSVEEARDVFFVRQAVERCVVERLCSSMSKDGVKRLRDHVKNERIANAEDSTTDIIKLSGGFHLLLAELTGSDFLFTTMRDLIARSSLITAVYRNTTRFNCGPDEHADIVKAIAAKEAQRAVHLMSHHLEHVESELDLSEIRDFSHDLRAALA
ncbi:GntR family transcriptional regulator [Sinorhizobium meliloti]|uniref:GntR family transcriptional regulator n=1 Tax=Rhizobium meliloti TaxID=382 RepID=UPI000FD23B21|nr:GntR family transcriptional regulator [Sinorhizobium meliloti]RVL52362.1 GntR family transcriptional regulator [Sinorhizobium meliloti]RVL70387.1 GntR family transcriptional regulator [Sinorhizobium meliloti]RVP55931.1 GntR family transcriptional regulator [Sinorhizobium meliloti]RVP87150.1 GntR family transcriptional regulator [Sinorhizobium meliloti]WQO41037.1 GntR family transcriptional regulator [Sinorhizobium meliloti]